MARTSKRRTSRRNPRQGLDGEWDAANFAQRQAERSGDQRAVAAAKAEVRRVYNLMQAERAERARRLGRNSGRRVYRNAFGDFGENTMPSGYDDDVEWAEAEATRLLRDDLETMLDDAERRIEEAEARIEGAATTIELQESSYALMRAYMLAEVAYVKNCTTNDSKQCYRSGDLMRRAENLMRDLVNAAVGVGIRQAQRASVEDVPKKKGWFSR